MAVAIQDRKRVSSELKSWLDDVKKYERTFAKWEGRVDKILKRYRDESRVAGSGYTTAKFNILWSNVQTLVPAVYSRLPQPDVSRRFRDSDPIGRIASLILERSLEYEVQHYPFYRTSMRASVFDRFLGGRGTTWVRYEPHISTQPGTVEDDGPQVTDNVEGEALEQIDYECTPVDYVHWRDFGHCVARTWPEVNRVWRKVYMTRTSLAERFGEEKAKIVPLDATPEELKNQPDYMPDNGGDRACIYEGWDKDTKEVVWFSKSVKDVLDRKSDPLQLERFFPCPDPLYATITNESLVPVPDFTLYQDQATALDVLCDREMGLITALKVTGVYDGSLGPMIARLFTEGDNNTLIPVKNWAAFAEKNGLKGAIDVVDLAPIAKALESIYVAAANVKEQIYEITGISDIVRGQTEASETLGAQEIKKQFVGLRLGDMKGSVARYATEILQIMAEIICTKYQAETLLKYSSADQLLVTDSDVMALGVPPEQIAMLPPDQKKQMVLEAAVQMLKNEPLRNFRIEIAADSLVQIDEETDKQQRVELLKAVGGFFEKALPAAQAAPQIMPLLLQLLKFGVTGFKVGKTIEGMFDEFAAKMQAQPPQPAGQDPKIEAEKELAQMEIQGKEKELAMKERGMARKEEFEERQMARQEQHDQNEFAMEQQRAVLKVETARAMPQPGRPQ